MKFATLFLLALLGPLAAAPATRPYDAKNYDARLKIDLAGQRIEGSVTITLASLTDQLVAVDLDAGDLTISSVTEGADKAYFERKDKMLIVALAAPAHKGDTRTLTIRYTGRAAKGLVFFPDQVYTSFFTSDWMPCNDRPEDRATLRLVLETPEGTKTAASGVAEGDAWVVGFPSAPFLYAFAVGDFTESVKTAGNVKMRVLGKAQVFDATTAALRFFTERTGHAFPGETYTQVFCHGNVEQEAVGLTLLPESYGEKLAKEPADLWLLAHELSHQWYAVGIPCKDWSDFWLNEGMSTFLADAFLEQRFGKARYEKEIESSRTRYEALAAEGKDRPLSFHDWETPQQAGGTIPYQKGAWVLAQLRKQLGDDLFWRGLRSYTGQRWNIQVTSEDFQKDMEESSRKDLSKFFQKWVY